MVPKSHEEVALRFWESFLNKTDDGSQRVVDLLLIDPGIVMSCAIARPKQVVRLCSRLDFVEHVFDCEPWYIAVSVRAKNAGDLSLIFRQRSIWLGHLATTIAASAVDS
jgi:hypothetical protein